MDILSARIASLAQLVRFLLEALSDVALPALALHLLMEAAQPARRSNAQVVHGLVKLLVLALPAEEEDLQPVLLALLGHHPVLHLVLLAQLALALTELFLQLALLPLIQSVAATLVQQRMQQVLVVFQQPLWLCPMQCHHPLSAQQRVL